MLRTAQVHVFFDKRALHPKQKKWLGVLSSKVEIKIQNKRKRIGVKFSKSMRTSSAFNIELIIHMLLNCVGVWCALLDFPLLTEVMCFLG